MTVAQFLASLTPPPVVVSDERFEVRRGDVTVVCELRTWGRKRKVTEWRCWSAATTPVEEIDNLVITLQTARRILLELKQYEQLERETSNDDSTR